MSRLRPKSAGLDAEQLSFPLEQPPLLAKGMTREAAFAAVFRDCVARIDAQSQAAALGEVHAIHNMRIAITKLRTAMRFFSPEADQTFEKNFKKEVAWINAKLSDARDLDVTLERNSRHTLEGLDSWKEKQTRNHEQLSICLSSLRYRRFIKTLTSWINSRSLSPTAAAKSSSLTRFMDQRLTEWTTKLAAKQEKIDQMGDRRLHRLRIQAKRLRYALEWSLDISTKPQADARSKAIKLSKRVQRTLGELCDLHMHQKHAKKAKLRTLPGFNKLQKPSEQDRLLKSAGAALSELSKIKFSVVHNQRR